MVLRNPASGGIRGLPGGVEIKPPFEMGVSDFEKNKRKLELSHVGAIELFCCKFI